MRGRDAQGVISRPYGPNPHLSRNRPTISTYNGWKLPYSGGFDPYKESCLQPTSFFPTQPISSFGNSTRYNPKFRSWPSYQENESSTPVFSLKEKAHLEIRCESFNLLNRTAFGPLFGATTTGNPNGVCGVRR